MVKEAKEKVHTEPNLTEKMCLYTSKCSPSLKASQQVARSLLSISTIQHNWSLLLDSLYELYLIENMQLKFKIITLIS